MFKSYNLSYKLTFLGDHYK